MSEPLTVFAALCLLIWLYLVMFHGGFWRADQRLANDYGTPNNWPGIVAVIPARNEDDVIERAVASLVDQDYPGRLEIVVLDDSSDDGTAAAARRGAKEAKRDLTVISGSPLPSEWSGKLWALDQGIAEGRRRMPDASYFLLTDADIEHGRSSVRRLVAKAERDQLDLVSLMVRLHCESWIERLLIPAFVYFFQQLYPFPLANAPTSRVAAAAGGCMLVRRDALERIGGIESIRSALIDDCALAARIKAGGAIWIGLAERSRSLRPYAGLGDIWRMVARTAYTQLKYSPILLFGTVLGLVLTYLGPPLILLGALLHGHTDAAFLGGMAWVLMAATMGPTLKLYGQPRWFGMLLPAMALLYTLMTLDSARLHWRGLGGAWKGRTYSRPARP